MIRYARHIAMIVTGMFMSAVNCVGGGYTYPLKIHLIPASQEFGI